jgi:GNAT superfamily N-acetyltransferase
MQRHTECLSVKSILLLPEYWGSGLGILMIQEIIERARARGYRWMDGSLTSADNPRTPAVAERLGAKIYKRYRTYKKKITVSD